MFSRRPEGRKSGKNPVMAMSQFPVILYCSIDFYHDSVGRVTISHLGTKPSASALLSPMHKQMKRRTICACHETNNLESFQRQQLLQTQKSPPTQMGTYFNFDAGYVENFTGVQFHDLLNDRESEWAQRFSGVSVLVSGRPCCPRQKSRVKEVLKTCETA